MNNLKTIRSQARSSLLSFSEWMFWRQKAMPWVLGDHHKVITDALEQVYLGKIKRLIINVPPRYSKTQIVKYFAAFGLGHFPDSEFIYTSYSGALATNATWDIREVVCHEEFRAMFPRVELRGDSSAKHEWRTTLGGVMYGVGSGGTITGYGAGKHRPGFAGAIIIDDPLKPDEATSDVIRQGVIDWFQNTLESRKNDPKNTPIIVIMQRLHEQDLSGWLLAGGNGEEWTHVCLPALREDGTALWPEKHSVEQLEQMKAANSYVFSGQYQQRPSPLGGGILRGAWFNRYRQAPQMRYRKIFADTAQKTGEANDYSVFQCWGAGVDNNAYLIDQIRGKWEAPELKRRAVDFWAKHLQYDHHVYGQLRAMGVEDKSSGTGLIQDLSRTSGIPVIGIERVKDKLTRVMDIAGYIESGRVYLPEDAPFTSDFIAECESFTPNDTHAHDDQIDPMCDAINDMVASGNMMNVWAKLAE